MEKCSLVRKASFSPQAQEAYELELNQRTTELIYSEQGVAPFDVEKHEKLWGDLRFVSIPVVGVRRFSRWVLPLAMEAAVALDNLEVKERLRLEDSQECWSVFPHLGNPVVHTKGIDRSVFMSLDETLSVQIQMFEKAIKEYFGPSN